MSGTDAVPNITVRPLTLNDEAAWRKLYRGYRDFYQVAPDDAAIDTVWSWLHDDTHEMRGLVACVDGTPYALAHYRAFARPLSASHGLYLDDLYSASNVRGQGLGSALIARLSEIARDEGATLVRWITSENNQTARSLYDSVSTQTSWVTYDLQPAT